MSINTNIAGRRALVTGGASGIGAAVSRRLIADGAAVVIADRNAALGRATADELGAEFHELDVSDSAAWSALVAAHEPFDIAFLNAGITTQADAIGDIKPGLPLANLTDAEYRRAMGVNLDGVVFGTRALVPSMCERGSGDIVCTSSLAGLIGMPMDPVYGANKHAVVGWVKSMAPLLEPHGVCISSLNPGFVNTPILGADGPEYIRQLGMPILDPAMIADVVTRIIDERKAGAQWVAWGEHVGTYEWNPPITL